MLTLLKPLDLYVWLSLVASLLVAPTAFFALGKAEGRLLGKRLPQSYTYSRASWFAFATFIGESIGRGQYRSAAWAIRQEWSLVQP